MAFEDPLAEAYFVAAFGAKATTEDPVATYDAEEIAIDPATVHADTGRPVLTGGDVG